MQESHSRAGLQDYLLRAYRTARACVPRDSKIFSHSFLAAYFAYKRLLEDPLASVITARPDCLKGHLLDVGANVGYTAQVLARQLRQSSYQVFAFEPDEWNLRLLQRVAARKGNAGKINVLPYAVGAQDGEIEFWHNPEHHGDHRVATAELKKQLRANAEVQRKPLRSLDSLFASNEVKGPVAFIKIDVQGYELDVLEGAKVLLTAQKPALLLEYSPDHMRALGRQPEALLEFLRTHNYRCEIATRGGLKDLSELAQHAYVDLFCTHA